MLWAMPEAKLDPSLRLQKERSLKPAPTAKANPTRSEITTFLELSTFKFTTGSLDRSAGCPETLHSTCPGA